MVGYDKEGSPIILIPYGGIDIWGILHSATKNDIVKRTVKLLEGFMGVAYKQSLQHGPEARKFVVIFDMEGFSMRHYAYRPAAELAINVFQMYSNNYPEILKCCYVINGESARLEFPYCSFVNLKYSQQKRNLLLFFSPHAQHQKSSRLPSTLFANSSMSILYQRFKFTTQIASDGCRKF